MDYRAMTHVRDCRRALRTATRDLVEVTARLRSRCIDHDAMPYDLAHEQAAKAASLAEHIENVLDRLQSIREGEPR